MGLHATSVALLPKRGTRDLRTLAEVIRLLGYDPRPAADSTGQALPRDRTGLGMTQKELTEKLGVVPSTLARWERDERVSTGEFLERAAGIDLDGSARPWALPLVGGCPPDSGSGLVKPTLLGRPPPKFWSASACGVPQRVDVEDSVQNDNRDPFPGQVGARYSLVRAPRGPCAIRAFPACFPSSGSSRRRGR